MMAIHRRVEVYEEALGTDSVEKSRGEPAELRSEEKHRGEPAELRSEEKRSWEKEDSHIVTL